HAMKQLFKYFDMRGDRANQIKGIASFLLWSSPSYIGWMHAARGKNEFLEWGLKFANTTTWFFCFMPWVINPLFKGAFNNAVKKATKTTQSPFNTSPSYREIIKRFNGPLRDKLVKIKNIQYGTGLIISTVMLGLVPQLINIWLTKQRYAKKV